MTRGDKVMFLDEMMEGMSRMIIRGNDIFRLITNDPSEEPQLRGRRNRWMVDLGEGEKKIVRERYIISLKDAQKKHKKKTMDDLPFRAGDIVVEKERLQANSQDSPRPIKILRAALTTSELGFDIETIPYLNNITLEDRLVPIKKRGNDAI